MHMLCYYKSGSLSHFVTGLDQSVTNSNSVLPDHQWFNFSPRSLIECGMQGRYHCWPISEHPEDGPKLEPFGWGSLAYLLEVGQVYE